jgi:two-component system chemotaxis response regulator CheB
MVPIGPSPSPCAVRGCAGELVETAAVPEASALLRMETRFATRQTVEVNDLGEPSGFSCPDRAGTLVELDAERRRFRCRVGHAWTALRTLEEK